MNDTLTLDSNSLVLNESNLGAFPLHTEGLSEYEPLGFDAGDTNLYRFVGNDPVNETDPSGLQKSPLSKPTDLNAIDSAQFNAIVIPGLKGHVPPNTPVNQLPFSRYFEAAVIRMLGETKYRRVPGNRFDSPDRRAKPNGRTVVMPDASRTIPGRTKQGFRLFRDSCFIDAKYGGQNLNVSSGNYEGTGYADVLSKSPAAKAGYNGYMLYVTTTDSTIFQPLVDEYTKYGVVVAQSYMARDPKTGKLYLTPPVTLNPALAPPVVVNAPPPQFTPDWNLLNPDF